MSDTDCTERFREYTRTQERVLDEDLEALGRRSERERIQQYNDLKEREAQFREEFLADCPDFLTDSERDRMRGQFRLARLLLAGSLYAEGGLPRAMEGDFSETELQAVVEFDRYRVFDSLSETQIERKIRRMDGEVYDLVAEYTSTQLSTIERLTERDDVQQDVLERLLARYEQRREKIRQGFFTYVETHGLEHMVAAIEDAVCAISDAKRERSEIRDTLETEIELTAADDLRTTHREVESELAAGHSAATDERIDERIEELETAYEDAEAELAEQLDEVATLQDRLESKIGELETVREETATAGDGANEEAATLLDGEIDELRAEQATVETTAQMLELDRERVQHVRERIDARGPAVSDGVAGDVAPDTANGTAVDTENAITSSVARLLEMDYLGRFDISMRETDQLYTQDGTVEIPEGYWADRSERRDERAYLAGELDVGADLRQYPLNQSARYEVTDSKYLGLSSDIELIVEAMVFTDLAAHARHGFDADRADVDDLLAFVNDAVYEASERDCTCLLAIASQTGWTDEVIERFTGDDVARTRFSADVSVVLVDLQDGSLVYDESDSIADENAHLFEPPLDSERVSEAKATIEDTYLGDIGRETVRVEEVVEEQGCDAQIVTRAFNELEREGVAPTMFVEELGLCLDVGR